MDCSVWAEIRSEIHTLDWAAPCWNFPTAKCVKSELFHHRYHNNATAPCMISHLRNIQCSPLRIIVVVVALPPLSFLPNLVEHHVDQWAHCSSLGRQFFIHSLYQCGRPRRSLRCLIYKLYSNSRWRRWCRLAIAANNVSSENTQTKTRLQTKDYRVQTH